MGESFNGKPMENMNSRFGNEAIFDTIYQKNAFKGLIL